MKRVFLVLTMLLLSLNAFGQIDPPFEEILLEIETSNVFLEQIEENTERPLKVVFKYGSCFILLSTQTTGYLDYQIRTSTTDIRLTNPLGTFVIGVIPGTDKDNAREFLIAVFNDRNGTEFVLADAPVVNTSPNCGEFNVLALGL